MSKKEKFIEELEDLIENNDIELSQDAIDYFYETLKTGKKESTGGITEKGKVILKYMKNNYDKYNNVYKAKDIGDGLGISGRSVSGSIKKLIIDGYVEKLGANPVSYGVTAAGKEYVLD